MRHGADWYKREPRAYLGGVQGLTAREHAVYALVLDLIYEHGGSVNNDPRWFAGWISDMGASAVRNTIDSLVAKGKFIIEGDQISQKRAKNEAKTQEELRENRRKAGKKGGEKSAFSRSQNKENSDLGEASASTNVALEKSREEYIDDDDDTRGRASPPPINQKLPDRSPSNPKGEPTLLERVLNAAGMPWPKSGDGHFIERWMDKLSLAPDEIIGVVEDITAKRGENQRPPSTLKYFDGPMADYAAARDTPAPQKPNLRPISGGNQRERHRAEQDAVTRAAVEKTMKGGW